MLWGKSSQYSLDLALNGPLAQIQTWWRREKSLLLTGNEFRSSNPWPITIPCELQTLMFVCGIHCFHSDFFSNYYTAELSPASVYVKVTDCTYECLFMYWRHRKGQIRDTPRIHYDFQATRSCWDKCSKASELVEGGPNSHTFLTRTKIMINVKSVVPYLR